MTGLPPLSFGLSSGANMRQDMAGAFSPFGGDWTVNIAGSGPAVQGAAGGSSPLIWLALIGGALWLSTR